MDAGGESEVIDGTGYVPVELPPPHPDNHMAESSMPHARIVSLLSRWTVDGDALSCSLVMASRHPDS